LRRYFLATLVLYAGRVMAQTPGEPCDRLGLAAGWTAWAGFSGNTPREVIALTDRGKPGYFSDLPWGRERVESMISEILALNLPNDRTKAVERRAHLLGEYYRIRCELEPQGKTFLPIAKALPHVDYCIKHSSKSKSDYEACIVSRTAVPPA
jgi:hypothetical protein